MVFPEWPRKESKNQTDENLAFFAVTYMFKMTKSQTFAVAKLS